MYRFLSTITIIGTNLPKEEGWGEKSAHRLGEVWRGISCYLSQLRVWTWNVMKHSNLILEFCGINLYLPNIGIVAHKFVHKKVSLVAHVRPTYSYIVLSIMCLITESTVKIGDYIWEQPWTTCILHCKFMVSMSAKPLAYMHFTFHHTFMFLLQKFQTLTMRSRMI